MPYRSQRHPFLGNEEQSYSKVVTTTTTTTRGVTDPEIGPRMMTMRNWVPTSCESSCTWKEGVKRGVLPSRHATHPSRARWYWTWNKNDCDDDDTKYFPQVKCWRRRDGPSTKATRATSRPNDCDLPSGSSLSLPLLDESEPRSSCYWIRRILYLVM